MKTMIARYPGRCARTGAPIRPGDAIVWQGRGRAYLADLLPATDDSEGAELAARYLRQSIGRSVSDVFTIGGRDFYRNKRGRCEDAPCCGCCTI